MTQSTLITEIQREKLGIINACALAQTEECLTSLANGDSGVYLRQPLRENWALVRMDRANGKEPRNE